MTIAGIREEFPGLKNTVYLNTATLSVGCAAARDAYEQAVEQWSAGRFDWTETERASEETRAMFAEIIGAHADEVAIVPAVSLSAGLVAANMPPARPGENILVAGYEFSSNYFPWLQLKDRGYAIRTLSPSAGDVVTIEQYESASDGGTRLIALSAVQSSNGYRSDLAAISRIASRQGAWLFVDACQAAGAVALDVVRDGIDFLATSSHKFLLGTRGAGYLFVRRGLLERIRPIFPGWKAARKPLESFYGPSMDLSPTASKLDMSLVWFATLAERASLGLFQRFGIQPLLDRNVELSRHLR
jgi:selenocysteine lyase/cysteine desulfurase